MRCYKMQVCKLTLKSGHCSRCCPVQGRFYLGRVGHLQPADVKHSDTHESPKANSKYRLAQFRQSRQTS